MEQKDTVDYKKLYEETLLKFNQQISELQAINQMLLQRLDLLLKATYGSKSERFSASVQSPGQLRLELEQEVLVEQISVDKNQKKASDTKKTQKKSPDIS